MVTLADLYIIDRRERSPVETGVSGQCLPVGGIEALADQGLGSFDSYHRQRLATRNNDIGTFAQRSTSVGDT